MTETASRIHSLLLPLDGDRLLVPNTAVAEIVAYREPEAADGGPEWFLGWLEWRGQRLPVVAFEKFIGGDAPNVGHRARMAIFNRLDPNAEPRFYGLLLQGLPRLVQATEETVSGDDAAKVPQGVRCHVMVGGEPASIPDLDALEAALRDA